jgi:TolB-like protein
VCQKEGVPLELNRAKTLLLFFWILCFIGCSGHSSKPPLQLPPGEIHSLAILPVENMAQIYGENTSIRNPMTAKVYSIGKIAPRAEWILTDHLQRTLQRNPNLTIISPQQTSAAKSEVLERMGTTITKQRMINEIGLTLKADAVIFGHLYRYEKRVGKTFSVEKPASLRFDLQLIQVHSGRMIWWDDFDETQKPLSENLFLLGTFLKRRGRWITAKEMAQGAIDDMLRGLDNP